MRRTILPLALLATFAVSAHADAAGARDTFDLEGEVYKGFKIEMKNAANRPLTTVKAGTHRIKIEDMGTIHNFHLKGPGVDRKTSITGVGETFWTVKLEPGTYTFLCDPHSSSMRGTFRVTS